MPSRWKAMVACWAFAGLLAAAGCGGSGDSDSSGTPAALNGPGGNADGGSGEVQREGSKPSRDPLHPVVVMETTLGSIKLRLDAERARLTVDNFLQYVDDGHYDGTVFHQVFPNQGIVGGGYTPEFEEKPVRAPIRNEADNGLKNRRGTIAMLRGPDIDSAQAQFFFNLADNEALDHRDRTPEGYGYCVFGEVIEGLDVLDRIAGVEVTDSEQFDHTPVETVMITDARQLK